MATGSLWNPFKTLSGSFGRRWTLGNSRKSKCGHDLGAELCSRVDHIGCGPELLQAQERVREQGLPKGCEKASRGPRLTQSEFVAEIWELVITRLE